MSIERNFKFIVMKKILAVVLTGTLTYLIYFILMEWSPNHLPLIDMLFMCTVILVLICLGGKLIFEVYKFILKHLS